MAFSGCEPGSVGGDAAYTEGGASSQSAAASGDVGNNDNAAEIAWDPVWHKTTPIDWPLADPNPWTGCGEGCRPAQSTFASSYAYYDKSYDLKSLVGGTRNGLGWSSLASGKTVRIAVGNESPIQAYISGYYISGTVVRGAYDSDVIVMNLITGETKVAAHFRYDSKDDKRDQPVGTALNKDYVFWLTERQGIFSRNLASGVVRRLYPKSTLCPSICATEKELICATDSAYILRIDAESGKPGFLDWGQNAQMWGYCSPDRKQYVWIDYRDPPGEFTDMSVTGGEVYLRDLEAQTTRRLTFDSPHTPRRKYSPAVGDKYVFWKEEAEPYVETFHPESDLSRLTVMGRYELATGRICKMEFDTRSTRASYGSKALRYFTNPEIRTQWHLVMWDSEHPSRQWVCND